MRKIIVLQSAVIGVLLMVLLAVASGAGRGWGTSVAHAGAAASAAANAGSDESAPPAVNGPTAPDAVTTGSTLVYFAPQDNDANATVVVLYNTTAATQTVVVKGYVAAAPPRRGTSTSGRTMWCICSATV